MNKMLLAIFASLTLLCLVACGGGPEETLFEEEAVSSSNLLRTCDDMQASYTRNCATYFGGEAECSHEGNNGSSYAVTITCHCGDRSSSAQCGILQ